MHTQNSVKTIAYIQTDFKEKFGIPRQSGRVPELMGRIVFLPEYRIPDALRGIESFSHLWLIFDFSQAHRNEWSPTVRPPRLGGNKRLGVFATRSPFRPNPIGLSSVRLLGVEHTEHEGNVLLVAGVDLLDGTPILDIKPYLPYTDSHPEAVGGFGEELKDYRLRVEISENLLHRLTPEKRHAALACLAEDPRPAYQNDPERIYSMRFSDSDIHFQVNEHTLTVIDITEVS